MMHWEWIVTAAAVIGVYVLYVSLIKKKNNLKGSCCRNRHSAQKALRPYSQSAANGGQIYGA